MDRDTALKMLESTSVQERLEAARFLARNCNISDLPALKQALQSETVSYVKRSLGIAITRSSNLPAEESSNTPDDTGISEEARKKIRTRETDRISGMILHEIASPLGLVRDSASQEVQHFANSKTKMHLDRLLCIFECIGQLKTAATTPQSQQFDLPQLIDQIIEEESATSATKISTQGPRPFPIVSDRQLLRLAISNGVRNAIEAVLQAGTAGDHSVVITWGKTNVDYWVTVIDRGAGVSGSIDKVFDVGLTTKKGHAGFGLAIARQAIESLYGSATLQPSQGGGTRFELRWDQ